MATHLLRPRTPEHVFAPDWLLILAGALLAWLLWPGAPH